MRIQPQKNYGTTQLEIARTFIGPCSDPKHWHVMGQEKGKDKAPFLKTLGDYSSQAKAETIHKEINDSRTVEYVMPEDNK